MNFKDKANMEKSKKVIDDADNIGEERQQKLATLRLYAKNNANVCESHK